MVRQIIMPLESGELEALSEAAESDLRSIGNQALHWVRTALKDRGLLNADSLDGEDEEEAENRWPARVHTRPSRLQSNEAIQVIKRKNPRLIVEDSSTSVLAQRTW